MLFGRIRTFVYVGMPAMFLVVARVLGAQGAPSQRELDEVTARGRALAGYQRAAWTASAQLMSTNPDSWTIQRYVAYHADSGWVVAFGRMSTDRDTFYVSKIGIPAAVNGHRVDTLFEFENFAEPGPDTDFLARAARAMDLAVFRHGVTSRAYTAAAIPNELGEWLVYLSPSADAANDWPLGDDVRYRISADGERVLETHRMHASLADSARTSVTSGERHQALRDLPEDSDVFHVLMRRPATAEVVVTPHYRYLIGTDGSIRPVHGKETVVGSAR